MSFLQSSLIALAAQSSNPRVDFGSSIGIVNDKRSALAEAMFPYVEQDDNASGSGVQEKDYNSYFDRLDAMAAQKAKRNANVGEGDDK